MGADRNRVNKRKYFFAKLSQIHKFPEKVKIKVKSIDRLFLPKTDDHTTEKAIFF